MIALDTNVLVRVLVEDDEEQAQSARVLLGGLTPDRLGFVCREVVVELVWVLERTYGLSRDRIAMVLEGLVSTDGLLVESADDVGQAAFRYRQGGVGFSDLMIAAAAKRSGATRLYTFDRKAARLEDCTLLGVPDS